jgi:hypothetical protein
VIDRDDVGGHLQPPQHEVLLEDDAPDVPRHEPLELRTNVAGEADAPEDGGVLETAEGQAMPQASERGGERQRLRPWRA